MGHRSLHRSAAVLSATLLASCLQLVATPTPAAAAITIHVPGDQPTISAAIAAAADGDTVAVAAGTYVETLSFGGKDVHLVSISGPATTKIRGVENAGKIDIGPGGSIEGFTIGDGVGIGSAGLEVVGSGSVVRGNRFERNPEGNGRTALLVWNSSALIEGNRFSSNTCSGSGRVVSVEGASSPTIVNNVFHDNECTAIDVNTSSGSALVENNTIVTGRRGLRVAGTPAGWNHEVRNNIITGQDIAAFAYSPTNVLFPAVENNLVFDNAADYVGFEVDPVGTAGNLRADPVFINAAAGDLRVHSTSPAVDAGSVTDAPTTDHDGSARPLDGPDADTDAEFDMGAFERDGSEPAAVPQTGVIDSAWSSDGILPITNEYFVSMAAVDSNRLFTASYREAESVTKYRVSKYEPAGTPSPGFGTNGSGTILRDFAIGGTSFPALLEPAGTGLLVVGEHYTSTRSRLGVARLNPDGTYNTSFSGDGRALYKVFTGEHDVVTAFRARVLPNGKIGLAVAALDYDVNGNLRLTGQSILRLNANGTADTSFSADARIPLTNDYSDVAFLPSGSVYAGRQAGSVHEVRKFNAGGNKDTTFSGDGIVSISCGSHLGANLTADATGRPVLMCVRITSGTLNLGIFRFTISGAVDNTYSGDGKTALVTTGGNANDSWTVHFDDQARPWAAIDSKDSPNVFWVYSLDANGAPNAAWSADGRARVRMPSEVDVGRVERGPSRLYVEDFPSATGVRITALAG